MNDKQRYFNEIAQETIKAMTTDVDKWMAFLKTMSYNYTFTYPEQIMIFAQRPNAILCKEFDEWRLEKQRYVKRGSKGIALFANNGYRSYLRYVFDVTDTGTRPNSLDLNELWKLDEQHQGYIQELLENEFKIKENDLLNQIPKVVSKLADEYWHDFEHEFADIVADSFLEEYDGYNKEVAFKRAVTVSATYCVYLRCIEHPENYFENDDFMSFYEFNTRKAINALGTAVNSITTQVLKEVELGIEQYKSEKERSIQDERNELFASGRLSNSQHGIERTEPSRIEQVGANEKDVSRGTQANDLQRHDSERNVDSSLDGSTGNSTEQNEIVDGAVVGKESSTEQENQSDGLGTIYEQPKKRSRRNREDGTNQQLSLLDFISEEEQIQFIDQTENKNQLSSVFSIEQEELNQFLIYGSNTTNSRMMIVTEFMKQKTIEDISQYLRSMYVGGYGIIGDHRNIAAWYGDDGIEFAKGNKAHFVPQAQVIPWLDVAKTIQSLLENGQFASNVELEEAPSFERKQLAEKLWYLYRDFDEPAKEANLLSKLGEFERKGFPEETQELAKMLQYESYVAILKDQFEEFINLYEKDRGLLRFHYHDCEDIKKRLVELSLPRISFETTMSELPPIKSFITDDEIEEELLQGSSFSQGKTRIFNYFAENHTNKEKAEFLKKEYGIGGRSHALSSSDGSGQDHDAKGIRYKKRDCDDVQLSWPQVVKRIDSLMLEERYFPEVMYEFDDEPSNEDMVAKETEVSKEQIVEESKEDDFPYEIGQMVSIDDTAFEITGMNDDIVQLLDKSLSYPVYRVEKKENFEQLVSPMTVNDIEEKKVIEANNFMITDEHLGEGGPKQKYSRNVEAIRLLYQLENEDRNATEEEQEVLSQYVGWGGLPDVFDSQKEAWAKEYEELKELLPEREYEMARASTLNAHYTSPVVIEAMYKALAQMGFTSGNILEPSMGIGNFFGMLPDEMRNSRLYGIELDSISGRIAKKLYPKADITIAGFETTDRRDFYDIAIGNVPFGNYRVSDKPYDKLGFSIHNYFFAKALDQIRPGGVIAFVTSRFTMDQQSPDVRKYIAQRAELLGAIRLPNNAFKANAGAEVVSDIIFLQKRNHPIDIEPDWVHLGYSDDIALNSYFVEHPNMILGELTTRSTAYGKDELTVKPYEYKELSALLSEAIINIHGKYQEAEITDSKTMEDAETIPADPDVKNYSYTVVNDEVYFRENSIMRLCNLNETAKGRIKGLAELRQIVNDLIEYQLEDYPNEDIKNKQMELNDVYDSFTDKYGLINSRGNSLAFSDDSSYYLLCSLENIDENGNLESKADMFTKRTIRPSVDITSVDTASEALAISIGERGIVDLPYMSELLGTPNDFNKIINELRGVIFKDPLGSDDIEKDWQTSDEYLSGNVREKLRIARIAAKSNPIFEVNVEALEKAQPKDLDASEIDVRLGATWIDKDYIQQFMYELFETPYYLQSYIEVHYSEMTAEWRITGKSVGSRNDVLVNVTYGTERANGFKILEDTLNLKDVRIYDIIEENGKQKRVLNKRETTLAQQKQQAIKEAFQDWIWKDAKRREHLIQIYNELFNSNRPREYDGSHIRFHGMNPDIELRPHQKNAVAHVLYGGNTLLAHEVGAGKSFEMAASAMESKRLGLCQKSLFVVPNHLTLQWANEFLRLYPSAKLLVASKKDFETANRKKFCARIATGDYDAVIIGHSQFERIPISAQRQEKLLREQIQDIENALEELKYSRGENFTIKQMEKTRKSLEARLDKLLANDKKDDVITFEQLGVDRLFVDESHAFKNLFLYTKMRNIAGLSTSEAQKSSDMFMKCRYMDEITNGKGVIFATGTPVSNSMTELYTIMRYLQYSTLQQMKLTHFDCWASTFGETVSAIELAPEGTGYRARTRFAKFFNLPELMNIFKEVADIKTSDQLNLPVPEAKFETVVVQPSKIQKEMVESLSERAALVHGGNVDPSVDNMLKITSDGRKIGLDQRLMNPLLPDDENSKLNVCVKNVLRIYNEGQQDKLTQLLFCDLSTPKNDETFNVYDDIKKKLIQNGVAESEIAFIHDADSEAKKKELFSKVRLGQIRVLLGSTQKMGAGTNVQDRLVAVHHLDVGWRPSDMTQRNGRIIRQGNMNKEVHVYQYVTEGTFDAYLYQTLENKQKFISQIMTSKSPVRSCDDVDEQVLSYAEIKALCAGNPLIKEKMDLDIDVARLKVLKADHQSQQYRMEDKLLKYYPAEIEKTKEYIKGYKEDIETVKDNPLPLEGFVGMTIHDKNIMDKELAGEAILAACKNFKDNEKEMLGSYRGFHMELTLDIFQRNFEIILKGKMSHYVTLGTDARGNITRLDNALTNIEIQLEKENKALENLINQQEATKLELGKPFPQEEELRQKSYRLAELDAQLNMDDNDEQNKDEKSSVLDDLKTNTVKSNSLNSKADKEAEYER